MAKRRAMATAGVLLLAAGAVHAQGEFPNRPIRILVGFTAGSGTDFLALRDVNERLLTQGATPNPSSPEKLDAFVKDEIARMAKVIQAAGIRVN